MERLEDRLLLSHADGSPVLDDNGFLLVELGDGNDVLLYEHLDAETSRLTINGDSHDYFRGSLLAIEIAAGGGADRIEIAGDVDVWATLDGQDGDDTLIGGAGPDELIAGDGTDSLLAAAGDDRLIVKPTDTFDSGDGADALIVQVGGTSGPDTIQIQVVDDLTSRLTINGVSIDYDAGELAEVEVSAGDGADLVEVAADLAIVATLVGGEGDDTLVAGAMSDSIDAGPGSDSVVAGDGYDTVVGGDGFDTIDAGAGDDVVDGGAGDDSIAGGDGANTLVGGWGGDTITAGDWSDAIEGGLAGGTVDDPSDGNDSIVAGAGDDTIFGSGGSDTIDAAAGSDTIDCGAGGDSVLGGDDADTIACGAGDDTVAAGDGDDVLNAGAGSNSVDGGNGFDILSFAATDEADSILIDDVAGTITVALTAATDSLLNIEHVELFAGAGDDSVSVSASVAVDMEIDGGAGNDTLAGGSGHDVLDGGPGADVISGGSGYDMVWFVGTDSDDSITAVIQSDGQVALAHAAEADTASDAEKLYLGGLAGNDSIVVSVQFGAVALPVWIEGDQGNDSMVGGPEADLLYGGEGDDSIDGGGGDDTLLGGDGNDSLSGIDGNDLVLAGWGDDTVDGGLGADVIFGWVGNDLVLAGDGSDSVVGGDGDDTIEGGIGSDSLYGGLGNDLIRGGDGNDTLGSDQGNDIFFGGAGDDSISGGLDDDVLSGGEGSDSLDGGAGADRLIGGDRNTPRRDWRGCDHDSLQGGADNDSLDGGRGRDALDGGAGTNELTADLRRDTIVPGGVGDRIIQIRKSDESCGNGNGRAARRKKHRQADREAEPERTVPPTAIRSGHGSTADLQMVEIVADPGPVGVGNRLDYNITIANNGPLAVSDPEIILDLPSGVTPTDPSCVLRTSVYVCPRGPIASGGTDTATISVQVGLNAPSTITITPLVTTGAPGDPVRGNNFLENTTEVTRTDLEITKADSPDPVASGEILTYTLTVTNKGTIFAAKEVVVSDTLPAGFTLETYTPGQPPDGLGNPPPQFCMGAPTIPISDVTIVCNVGTVAPGGSATVTLRGRITAPAGTILTNWASVTSVTGDDKPENNTARVDTPVRGIDPTIAELSITKTGPQEVVKGGTLTYTIAVRNDGFTNTATGVKVTDTLPPGVKFTASGSSPGCYRSAVPPSPVICDVGNLPPNATATLTIKTTVTANAGSKLWNRAQVSANTAETNYQNNTATAVTTVSGGSPCTVQSVSFEEVKKGKGGDLIPNDHPPYWGDGILPDRKNLKDNALRRLVQVVATVSGSPTNVYFKSFDVDDPETNLIIDPNGLSGLDNRGSPREGRFVASRSSIVAVTPKGGKAVADFEVTMQPGDNFRVAATCNPEELDVLTSYQIHNYPIPTIVPPANNDQISGFTGKLTNLLTVWRRLHVEVDSMAGADDPPSAYPTDLENKDVRLADIPDPDPALLVPAFEAAYVRVLFDTGNSQGNLQPFIHNADSINLDALGAAHRGTAEAADYWAAYIMGAYEPAVELDHDPTAQPARFGVTQPDGLEYSFLFFEVVRDVTESEYDDWAEAHYRKRVVVHEIGHQFELVHWAKSVMDDESDSRGDPTLMHFDEFHKVHLVGIRSTKSP